MRRLFCWTAVALYSAAVIIQSILPLRIPEPVAVPFIDKYIHAATYLVLSWLLVNTLIRKNIAHARTITFSYAFLLGTIIECIQFYIPYRSFEVGDILANAIGSSVGMLILAH